MAHDNGPLLGEKGSTRASRSPARSPGRKKSNQKLKYSTSYASDGVEDNSIFNLPGSDWQLLGVLTVVACAVRLFRISQPTSVVFDEVHFGGFATKYIKGRFFMDVHPPLAKMLIALFGWLAGFDGEFDFKDIGKDYLEPGVPYVAMRLYPALCGVMTIPTIFLTLKASGCKSFTAALGAGLVIFENGLLTNNRLILLDSPLITATAFTALCWTCFTNLHEQGPSTAFKPSWWFWLAATGFMLGVTVSIKWVGLFTIGWVGALTVLQLWVLLGDPKYVTPRLWFKHVCSRAFCLIVIPVGFYMAMFAIHFVCLVNPGEGDGFMSSEFQATLNHKGMNDVPADVVFGSRIALRHHNTQGGYLHSHPHMYPEGSKQQQITLYPHKDENNLWLLENQTQPEGLDGPITGPSAWDTLQPEYIKNGDVIKLYHVTTDRRLHSHDVRPPVTDAEWQQEVSAYGYKDFEGDANDMFRVEIVKDLSDGVVAKERLRTIQSKFKLVHIMSGCVLFSHKVKLPDWAWEQQEVTCAKGGTLPNSIWYIEQNEHPMMGANVEKVNYRKPTFLGKFWELQRVMWTTNAGLTESHAWDSRPPSWPILSRGINFWGKDHTQIYLFGNPVIWLSSTVAIAIYALFKGIAIIRWQRGFSDYRNTTFKRFDYDVGTMVLGWAFHYFPFFLMSRQLFLHHYFPALYIAIIALCQIFDFAFFRVGGIGLKSRPAIGQGIMILFLAVSITVFTLFAPIAYGNRWTKAECSRLKLFSGWDWDCNQFFDTYDEYNHYKPTVADAAAAASVAEGQNPVVPVAEEPKFEVTPQADQVPFGQYAAAEQKVEYRDENGNLLDPEQVKELEGKVSFETRYETKTRLVDEQGQEIANGVNVDLPANAQRIPGGVAPPHPDVEGQNPNTAGKEQRNGEVVNDRPATAEVGDDIGKERSAEYAEGLRAGEARPGSERDEATKKAAV
ncbi:hypothetical protein FH972_024169 [Carpinus fangiana]|uniref:dolichyl-phosphate-mannose--protein mannosyltransferase n=1 Tax=Carpinus fangiana TaxID=176857 RepID=A0A5N6KXR3_9ROSI|nr:hypothetical protein FH972_024169 [Carpinus fangiana]